jgi:proteasome lid subunit RPN8/RPN11
VTTPWLQGVLEISAKTLAEVERIAVSAYLRNEESCGFLAGPALRPHWVDEAVEMENLANRYHAADPQGHPRSGNSYFKIHSLKFQRALSERTLASRPVKVFFHSHLDCGAYFSEEDARSMTLGDGMAPLYPLRYWVTAVDMGRVTDHRLFEWAHETKCFTECAWAVVD